jgi:DNA polymerase III alpha subunit
MIPRLNLRTEFSFRRAYGRVKQVAERCVEIGATYAGIVDDDGTWGHVQWEKAALEAGLEPLFGLRLAFPTADDRKPSAWLLAEDSAALYRLSSRFPFPPEALADARGVVRMAGNALTDPELFDYIDINQLSRIAARRAVELHKSTGKPLLICPHNDYPAPSDRDAFLAWDDSKRLATQHIMDDDELREAFAFLDDDIWDKAVKATYEVASRVQGVRLRRAPLIHVEGNLAAVIEAGKQYRLREGHISEWTAAYQERLEYEYKLIVEKEFESYFLAVSDMVQWAKTQMLVGPGRG